ncbi:MAG: MCE family protein [Alphaproteobacteria bacterium]|nr:MCE family protein [Alphaproteobacteria bacterium]
METRANYVLIGAFVLMGVAALMLFTVWISREPFSRDYELYDVVFEGPVNGLGEGGEVRFNGIKVGEVDRLSLDRQDPSRVVARIKVQSQTPVRVDSVAQLNFMGITGVTFIQILAGSPGEPLLTRTVGGPPPVIRAERTTLDELFEGGQDLLTVSSQTITALNQALTEDNVKSIGRILKNLEAASEKLSSNGGLIDEASAAIRSVDRAAVAMEQAAVNVDVAATGFDSDFKTLAAGAETFLEEARPVVAEARTTLAAVGAGVDQINSTVTPSAAGALDQLSRAAGDLRSLILRLEGVAVDVENDPSRFVYRQSQPVE